MIEHLPLWINMLFIAATIFTIGIFYLSNGKGKKWTLLIFGLTVFQSILAYAKFYQNTDTAFPRFALAIIPAVLLITYSLLPKQRDWILQHRNTKISTFLHLVRFPIEIVLFQLFVYKMIPELMTFEGRNFDIIAGITAPIVGYLFLKAKIGRKLLLIWNILGIILITFILFNGILSAELPFQQFGFEQPNRAVTYFPFVILPAVIVPIVFWTHLTDIIKLRREIKSGLI